MKRSRYRNKFLKEKRRTSETSVRTIKENQTIVL